MAFQFGSGVVWMSPVGGNEATDPTPKELGTIESASCEFTGTLKELIGFNQFPDDVAVGEKKVSGKIVMGRIDAGTFNNVFFADIVTAGSINDQYNEIDVVPGTPYEITVTPPSSGTFQQDLGVIYGSGAKAGTRLTRLPTGTPAAGQYTINEGTGEYTFAAADTGITMWISYQFLLSSTGSTYEINNQVMGYGPILAIDLLWGYQSGYTGVANAIGIHLYNARVSKLSLGAKNTDYVKPEMDFSAFANAAGQVGYFIQNVA
jgi:hypothetical protein